MSVVRKDCLKECNEHSVPLDQFQEQFCSHCVQPECTRSQYGTFKFDRRVATWKERLFTKVPLMDPKDPRFPEISGKQFKMMVPTSRLPEVGNWVEPSSLSSEGLPKVGEKTTEPSFEPLPPEAPPKEELLPPEPPPKEEVREGRPGNAGSYHRAATLNTRGQSGKVLQGAPPPQDPWKEHPAPKMKAQGETIVKRGATIRLGGGGNGVE